MSDINMNVKLLSGNVMPLIGFGTFQIAGTQLIYNVVNAALRSGYRSFDTAAVYGNEHDIGFALRDLLPKYNLTREDIFITSKLSPSDHGEKVSLAIERSLRNLGVEYLDLYLIHWPGASGIPVESLDNKALRNASWKAMIRAKKDDRVRAIGVSNYTVKHLEDLLSDCDGVKPDVNQVEWHPHYYQPELLELCRKEGILLQAYSSLGGGNFKTLITDPVVHSISRKLEKSPAQVLLRWAIQQNIAIIPKTRKEEHMRDNLNLNFKIPDEDMKTLNNLNRNSKYAWDPTPIA